MSKIGLFYGSETGKTADAAEKIQEEFGGDGVVEIFDISDCDTSSFDAYDCLIIGCPTWNIGEIQSDWDGMYGELDDVDFSGKKVAYFGTGDQVVITSRMLWGCWRKRSLKKAVQLLVTGQKMTATRR